MPLSAKAETILKEIFAVGADRALGIGRRLRAPTPKPEHLFELCELLAREPREEELQLFLENNVGFLTGLLGGPDNSDLAVLFKPKIGTKFIADFCVLQAHQGGAVTHMIEIETSHEPLYTRQGNPARRLAMALKQLDDWRIEIDKHSRFYAEEFVKLAQKVPEFGCEIQFTKGVRFTSADKLESYWRAFGGFEKCYWTYTAIVGRWSTLDDDGKARFIHRNQSGPVKIHTFEQLARNANFRLERDDWFNDLDNWS